MANAVGWKGSRRIVIGIWVGILLVQLMFVVGKQNMPFYFADLRNPGTRKPAPGPDAPAAGTLGNLFSLESSNAVQQYLRMNANWSRPVVGTDVLLHEMTGACLQDETLGPCRVHVPDPADHLKMYITIPCLVERAGLITPASWAHQNGSYSSEREVWHTTFERASMFDGYSLAQITHETRVYRSKQLNG